MGFKYTESLSMTWIVWYDVSYGISCHKCHCLISIYFRKAWNAKRWDNMWLVFVDFCSGQSPSAWATFVSQLRFPCLILAAVSLFPLWKCLDDGITQHWRPLSDRLKRSSLCLTKLRHIFLPLKPYLSYVCTFPLISQLPLVIRCEVTRSVTLSCPYT